MKVEGFCFFIKKLNYQSSIGNYQLKNGVFSYLCTIIHLKMFSKLLSTALVTDSTWIILLVMLIILFAPMILRPLRIPHILGMILAGVLIGPFGLNVLERDKSFELFGQVGLYYIMFLAALEMDTRSLFRNVKQYLFFGFATFIIPFTLGFFGSRMLLGYNNAQSLLIAGILSSNTLIAYPIIAATDCQRKKASV